MTETQVRGERFFLLPERCAYHENSSTLLAADLHWGKPEVFQRHGIPVSSRVLEEDLARLSQAIRTTRAKRLVVLGDLIHAVGGVTTGLTARIAAWRATHADLIIQLARGNHDRDLLLPPEWRIEMHEDGIREGPFFFAHEPPAPGSETSDLHAWTGHLHPLVRLKSRTDSLRLPCFLIGAKYSVVPAFSAFTAGQDIRAREWRQVFAIAEATVMEV